jgi:methylenetetrahydrofolate dehydrogenase (NADP+) / methenyltetrahydrofolate cyclohydrolase
MAQIIDGKQIALDLRAELKEEVAALYKETDKKPGLAVVLVGEDPASQVYVRNKKTGCAELGIESFEYLLDKDVSEKELLDLIAKLNADHHVNGILVQLPLPKHISEKKVINAIDYRKDVDGFHPVNQGKILIGDDDGFIPCTPNGCKFLINKVVKDLSGKHLVVVGRSNIVGKPLANIMLQKKKDADCVVTVCHSAAKNLSELTRQGDILVAAIGRPEFITADMVKEGAVVIDVGVNRIPLNDGSGKTKLVGDVAFGEVSAKASFITPVPGGVGPMTITMLMLNTVQAFKQQNNLE